MQIRRELFGPQSLDELGEQKRVAGSELAATRAELGVRLGEGLTNRGGNPL